MRVVAILQARMNSTRLPGKVMMPLAGKPMVQNIVERVQRAKRIDDTVVAIPFGDLLNFTWGLDCVCPCVSPENDLVGRYLDAAEVNSADLIVRVPCDNPCVDPDYIDAAVERYLSGHKIFMTNTSAYIDDQCVDGLGCEVFSLSRLKWLDKATRGNAQWREHPHAWFYEHLSDVYDPHENDTRKPVLRLDVNTQADYDFIASIYNHFGHNRFTAQEVLACPPVQERLHGR